RLLEEPREAEEDLAALRRRYEPPLLVGLLRRRDRAVGVLGAGLREHADGLARRRAPALEGLAASGLDPLAADEVLEGLRLCRRHAADSRLRGWSSADAWRSSPARAPGSAARSHSRWPGKARRWWPSTATRRPPRRRCGWPAAGRP